MTEANIAWNSETDKYDNQVSVITLTSGIKYRMVAHSKPQHTCQKYTIYAGKNKFMRLKIMHLNLSHEASLELADYFMGWENNELQYVRCNPLGPDIKANLKLLCHDQNFDTAIIVILTAIHKIEAMWMAKADWTKS